MSFKESQRLRHPLLWLVYPMLFFFLGMFVYAIWQQVFLHRPFGEKPAPDAVLFMGAILLLCLLSGLGTARLQTVIDADSISYRWYPIRSRFTVVNWKDIGGADLYRYKAGGIGYRFTPDGTVHSAGGDTGLRLRMKTGKVLILGTRRPDAIQALLAQKADEIR